VDTSKISQVTLAIFWRLYLTVLSLSILSLLIAAGLSIQTYFVQSWHRKILMSYMLETYGNSDGFVPDDSVTKPTFDPSKPFEPVDEKMKDQLVYQAFCFNRLVKNGGVLWNCTENIPLPKRLADAGLSNYDRVGGSVDFRTILFCVFGVVGVLIVRYWLAWLFTGVRPRSFP
jgi:hypothetical protein